MKRVNELFDVKEDFKIISLHSDSRYVGKDSVFFCIEGLTTDGHRYADDAVFQGAKVIVHS
ncbi:Mur ligase domain-containing protein, partial [Intestinibaculum porci]